MTYTLPSAVDLPEIGPGLAQDICEFFEVRGSLPYAADELASATESSERAFADVAHVLEAIHIFEARRDPGAFVQYAFRHEEKGTPIENASHHLEWHKFLNEHDRAILFAPVEHAKTQHIAVGRALWSLGKNPSVRLAVISNTYKMAEKVIGQVRRHIESNPRVHKVFPELRKSEDIHDKWDQHRLVVERDTNAKDPSIQGLGAYGAINGSRLDGIIIDDILNMENTRTADQVEKMVSWLDTEVFTRVTDGGWCHWIGTPWTPLDPMHEVAKRTGWASARYSGVLNPDDPMDQWVPMWPEAFNVARLKKIYEGTTPVNFARKYLCRVRMDSASRFKKEWIEHAKYLGRGMRLTDRAPAGPGGQLLRCYTGVDLAVGKGKEHDKTVIFTVAIDQSRRKRVVNIQSGRWSAPEIIGRITTVVDRFDSSVLVEDNAAQAFLLQFAQQANLPVRGFTTTAGKKFDEHYGVESLAVEIRNGGWVIPSGIPGEPLDPELEEWISGMLYYSPDAHTSDHLMASWLAREESRHGGQPIFTTVDTISR